MKRVKEWEKYFYIWDSYWDSKEPFIVYEWTDDYNHPTDNDNFFLWNYHHTREQTQTMIDLLNHQQEMNEKYWDIKGECYKSTLSFHGTICDEWMEEVLEEIRKKDWVESHCVTIAENKLFSIQLESTEEERTTRSKFLEKFIKLGWF